MMRLHLSVIAVALVATAPAMAEEQEFRARIRKGGQTTVLDGVRAQNSYEAKKQLEMQYGKEAVEWVYPKPRQKKEEAW